MRIGVLLLALLLWFGAVPVQAQQTASADRPTQAVCKVGVYVMDLYNFDTRAKRFGADIWAWSVCPGERNAIKSADWINAEDQTMSLDYAYPTDLGLWSGRKIVGVYRESFDVGNYPFDRHSLRIIMEDSSDYASALKYVADIRGSSMSPDLKVNGWEVTRFTLQAREAAYNTSFGDPTLTTIQQTNYPHLEIVIDIKRTNLWTFWKLAAPVFISSLLILLTFLVHDKDGQHLKARRGFVSASLIAIVINMRGVEGVVGETSGLSLMDSVHILALLLAVLAVAAPLGWSFLIRNGWSEERIVKWDTRFFFVSTGLYIAANMALIGGAVQEG
jgi:hypothetical protein